MKKLKKYVKVLDNYCPLFSKYQQLLNNDILITDYWSQKEERVDVDYLILILTKIANIWNTAILQWKQSKNVKNIYHIIHENVYVINSLYQK